MVNKLSLRLAKNNIKIKGANILILGIAFKENCPDIRNSKVVDVINELKDGGSKVSVYDPIVCSGEVEREYGISINGKLKENSFDALVIAVGHDQFKEMGLKNIRKLGRKDSIIFDLKYLFNSNQIDLKL